MSRKIDGLFCALLALGTLGHLFGTFKFAESGTGLFAWSLSGVLAAALVTALNALRISRPQDRTVTWLALAGSLGWIGIVVLFGQSLGTWLDPRVLFHGAAAAGLACFSVRSLT